MIGYLNVTNKYVSSRGPSSSCVLPQYTHNVNYTTLDCLRGLSTQCPPQPGTDVTEGYVLRFTCREGYQLDDGKNTHAHVSLSLIHI